MRKVSLTLTEEQFKAVEKALKNEQTRLFMLDEECEVLREAYQEIKKTANKTRS